MNGSLASGYHVEVDCVVPLAWYKEVAAFGDANLYQVWQQGAGAHRFTGVSRFVVSCDNHVAAMAEVRLRPLPIIRGGMAYVLWGPLFRRSGADPSRGFRNVIRAMRNEYVVHRGMVLRINPRLFVERDHDHVSTLMEEGFLPVGHLTGSHSLIVDLSRDPDEIRRGLEKKWRNCLSKAERSCLTIRSGTTLDLFDSFVHVYDRMLRRKQFTPSADVSKHRCIQQELPEPMKMKVVLACFEDKPCAGAIYSALGDTAVYLFGATDEVGMRCSASYLVQWQVVQELKELGVAYYDLNGVDPGRNPGTYVFKRGLAGKEAIEVTFAGQFQATNGSIASRCVVLADQIRHQLVSARARRAARGA